MKEFLRVCLLALLRKWLISNGSAYGNRTHLLVRFFFVDYQRFRIDHDSGRPAMSSNVNWNTPLLVALAPQYASRRTSSNTIALPASSLRSNRAEALLCLHKNRPLQAA